MITKIHPVYPNTQRDIPYYIRYITDPCKTLGMYGALKAADIFLNEAAASDFVWGDVSLGGVVDALRYICAYLCTIDDFESLCQSLESTYLHYHGQKRKGPIAYHIILSWPANALITDQDVLRCGVEFLQKLGPYPAVLGAHIEPCWDEAKQRLTGTQKHCHMLVSAYPNDNSGPTAPAKLNLGHHSIKARELSDIVAIQHAQEIIVAADTKRNRTYNLATDDTAYVNQLITLCEDVSHQVHSWSEYQAVLYSKGCTLEKRGPAWIYTISTPDGEKHIPERSLGVALSKEALINQWYPRPELPFDQFVSATHKSGKNVFVEIPLGGWRHKEQRCCLFPLDIATRYSSEVLKSYFADHQVYTIVDNDGSFLRNASGSVILDYLGVNAAENAASFIASAEYRRNSCTKDELYARIDRQIARITYQFDHKCERNTEDFFLQNIYTYNRWVRKGCPPPSTQWELRTYHDYGRHADGSPKSLSDLMLEVLLEHISPTFSGADYYTYKRYAPAFAPATNWEVQAPMDAMAIWREEEEFWPDIDDAAHDAERRYEFSAKDLAEVELALKDNAARFSVAEYCRKKRAFLEARLRELGSVDAVRAQYPKEFAAYEASVVKAKQLAMRNWSDVMALCAQHKHLQSLHPILLSTAAAEFERMKKLTFAREQTHLERIRDEIERITPETERLHPSLSSTIDDASARASATQEKFRIFRKHTSHNDPHQNR